MKEGKIIFIPLVAAVFILVQGISVAAQGVNQEEMKHEERRVLDWRKERDAFFKSHQRSPLLPHDKSHFGGLRYYPFDPKYVFSGQIERFIFHINNPKYYATFLTNKGTNKRYLRYGKFHFRLGEKESTLEIY